VVGRLKDASWVRGWVRWAGSRRSCVLRCGLSSIIKTSCTSARSPRPSSCSRTTASTPTPKWASLLPHGINPRSIWRRNSKVPFVSLPPATLPAPSARVATLTQPPLSFSCEQVGALWGPITRNELWSRAGLSFICAWCHSSRGQWAQRRNPGAESPTSTPRLGTHNAHPWTLQDHPSECAYLPAAPA